VSENLFDLFRDRFPADMAQPFIEHAEKDRIWTYADLDATSARYANLLVAVGVQPGDRVAAQVDKSPEAIFLYLACVRAGAVYLPLNTAYKPDEIDYFLSDAEPAVVVCRPGTEGWVGELAEKYGVLQVLTLGQNGDGTLPEMAAEQPDGFETVETTWHDLAAILYTSGTTGRSKGAMLSHWNLASNALSLHEIWGFGPDDVLLHALPIFHTHGLFVATNCVLLNGTKMLFMPSFDPITVLRCLPQSTVFMGVPTFYTRLLEHNGLTPARCGNMRLFISGSAPLLSETFKAFEVRTGHRILERYGMTETGMNTSNPLDDERRPGTVGFPLPEVELRVCDDQGNELPQGEVGILEVRGPNVFLGYWRNPEKTAQEFREDGFFITGDVAKIDEDGYVHIVGRAKDLIISGGYNVYPKEIETVLDAFYGVGESAVFGVPHPDFGEAVVAVIKPKPDTVTPGPDDIIEAAKKRLANYKVPKRVFFVEDLPRNAMGKVQKNVLRQHFADLFTKKG